MSAMRMIAQPTNHLLLTAHHLSLTAHHLSLIINHYFSYARYIIRNYR